MGTRSLLLPLLNGLASLRRHAAPPPEALVAQARAIPGEAADGTATALAELLRALDQEAALSPFGRLAAGWDIERFLGNLRRMAEAEAAAPEILAEPVEAPLIVTGMPRSGTTFLHALLAEDPASDAVRCWQTVYPYPPARGGDHRARQVGWQLRAFGLLAPEFRSVHPVDGNSPQECTEITGHVFQSLRFDTTHDVPSYRRWLDARGHLAAYRFHRRFLQHLQHQHGRRRWVLKSPDHVFALDALHQVYPDARIVFVHRDPLKILPSVARLTDVLRAPFTRHTDPLQIGQQVMRDWMQGAGRMIIASRDWPEGVHPPFHVQYRDIVARPLETAQRLYRHFDMELTPDAAGRIGRLATARPGGGYGRNVYNLAAYGIDPETVRERFRAYEAHFGIVREVQPQPPTDKGDTARWSRPLRSTGQHAGS